MFQKFHKIEVRTKGQNLYNFTSNVQNMGQKRKIRYRILNINILHTSASLMVQENADPDVMKDMKNFFEGQTCSNE